LGPDEIYDVLNKRKRFYAGVEILKCNDTMGGPTFLVCGLCPYSVDYSSASGEKVKQKLMKDHITSMHNSKFKTIAYYCNSFSFLFIL